MTRAPRSALIPAGRIQRAWKASSSSLLGSELSGVEASNQRDCILAAMPPASGQQGPIAVYGATGYTGRLVIAELANAGADLVLSGRNRRKLDVLASELEGEVAVKEATLDDTASLRALLADFVPGDMIASLTADGLGDLDELSINYCWRGFTPSQGTARTTLEIISEHGVEWREGTWVGTGGQAQAGTYEFPAPVGRHRMIRYPSGEQITVPRHIPTRNVRTTLNASAFGSDRLAPLTAAMVRPAGLAMRTPLKRLARAVVSRLPEGPTAGQRDRMGWMIVCEAKRGEVERRGVISGKDVYGLTAAAIAQGAMIAAGRGFEGRGALAPSQAFDPKEFLSGLDRFEVRWNVEGVESPLPVEA